LVQLAKSKRLIIMVVGNQGIRLVDLLCRSTWTPVNCEMTDVAAHKVPHAHLSWFSIGDRREATELVLLKTGYGAEEA
jgi:hypothetical protein